MEVSPGREPVTVTCSDEIQSCTAEVRLIHESSAGTGNRTEATFWVIRPNDDPIACLMCRERSPRREDDERRMALVEEINRIRATGPPECGDGCAPLALDDRLIRAASAYAIDLVQGDSYSPSLYSQFAGVGFLNCWGTYGFISKPEVAVIASADDIRALAEKLFLSGQESRLKLLDSSFTRIGVAFVFTFAPVGDPNRGWIVTLILADLETQSLEDDLFQDEPPGGWSCNFACVRDIRYHRKKVVEDPLHPEENILEDFITFQWKTPLLCNLNRIELHGDVRGTRYIIPCDLGACKGDIPPSKSLVPILGGKELEFDMLDIPPYPGERFEVWGYLHGVDSDCSPTLIAAGYFKHFCHTSGIVQRILLVEGTTIVDQRTGGSTPSDWIGDERLRYEVLVEGALLIVIPSDFAGYAVGDRVVIQKGGTHTVLTPVGLVTEDTGCKDPKDGTPNTMTLRSTIVRPIWSYGSTIRTDGVILPQKFWGI